MNLTAKMAMDLPAKELACDGRLQSYKGVEGATHHSTDRQTGYVDRSAHKTAFLQHKQLCKEACSWEKEF